MLTSLGLCLTFPKQNYAYSDHFEALPERFKARYGEFSVRFSGMLALFGCVWSQACRSRSPRCHTGARHGHGAAAGARAARSRGCAPAANQQGARPRRPGPESRPFPNLVSNLFLNRFKFSLLKVPLACIWE